MEVTVSSCQFELKRVSNFDDFKMQVLEVFEQVPLNSDYVLLPELFTFGLLTSIADYDSLTVYDYQQLTNFTQHYMELFQQLAQDRQQVIIAGSTLEKADDGVYNTTYIFDTQGNVNFHRKTHIFPAEANWNTVEGDNLDVFSIGPITFGIAICYEIEIPEIAQIYQQKGADIIFCPSYTFSEYGYWRVRHCAQARAIENQVFVVHSPTVGQMEGIVQSGYGRTSIISPCDVPWIANGILAESNIDSTDVITSTLNLQVLYENRLTGAATTVKDRKRRSSLYNTAQKV